MLTPQDKILPGFTTLGAVEATDLFAGFHTDLGHWTAQQVLDYINANAQLPSTSQVAGLDAALAAIPLAFSVLTVVALKSVSVGSIPDGTLIMVRNAGLFRYSASAGNPADDTIYVAPNSGSGRWIRIANNLAVPATSPITSGTSATVAATDFGKEIGVAVSNAFTYNLPDSTTLSLTPGFYFDVVQQSTGVITFAGMTNGSTTSLVYGNTILQGGNANNTITKVRVKLYATNTWLIENNPNLQSYNTITATAAISTAHLFFTNQCNSASAIALTIPTDAAGTIITGAWARFIQKNTGQITFPISSGITVYNEILGALTSASGVTPKLVNSQGATAWLERISPSEYLLKGDITS